MADYEGEYEVITGVIPKEHKDYRTWVYNRIDGEMLSKIVTGPEAEVLYDEGWKMTPAAFTEDEALQDNPQFEALADDMAQVMNFLLNLDHCDDLMALREFAVDFIKVKPRKNATVAGLRKAIKKKANEEGLL